MIYLTTTALFFLAAGLATSPNFLGHYQKLLFIPMVYYSITSLRNKDFKLPKSAWFLLIFTGIALLSLIVNYDIIPRPHKNFGRLKYFLTAVFSLLVLKIWIKEASLKAKKVLFNVYLLTLIIASVFAFSQFLETKGRVGGFLHIMSYGYGSGMALILLIGVLFHFKDFKNYTNKYFLLFTLFCGFTGFLLTQTRGAFLGFAAALPFVLYFFRPQLGKIIGVAISVGVLSLGTYYFLGSGNSSHRILMNKDNHSDTIRRFLWKSAIIATAEKPILGWGLTNYHTQLQRIEKEYNLKTPDSNFTHAHNLFLEILSGTGILGLGTFLLWLFFWFLETLRGNPKVKMLIIPFGVAMVVSSQFEFIFDSNNARLVYFIYAFSSAFNLFYPKSPEASE